MRVVTLLTDFGDADTYVGQVKGVVLAIAPRARLVDLTHRVPPQDVRAGAFLLWTAVEAFAPGTVHLAVVDPGVGSARRGLALRTGRGDVLVGPDNGLLLPAARRLGGLAEAVVLDRPERMRPAVSSTFHARDVFGPVAALLATGLGLCEVGSPIADPLEGADFPPPVRTGKGLVGRILHVDGYGNLVTNLPQAELPERFGVRAAGRDLRQVRFYAQAQPDEAVALVGSHGLLELAVRDGSAAARLGLGRDAEVELYQR